jgi:hypothetical protein
LRKLERILEHYYSIGCTISLERQHDGRSCYFF